MIDADFIAHVQTLHAKGVEGLPQMRELLRNGNLTRLIELAALGVEKKKKTPKLRTKQESFPGMQFPTWWPIPAWENYLAMRKKKRTPTTDRAVEMIIAEVTKLRAAGHDPAAAIDQSTLKGWTEIYAPKAANGNGAAPHAIERTNLAGWIGRLAVFYEGDEEVPKGFWSPKWGAAPGISGCVVPAEAVVAYSAQSHRISIGGK